MGCNIYFLTIKKLLGIVVLGLLLSGCNQNRNNEYICNPITQGGHSDVSLEIYKDGVCLQSMCLL